MKGKAIRLLAICTAVLCLLGCGQGNDKVMQEASVQSFARPASAGTTDNVESEMQPIDTESASDIRDQKYTNVPGAPTQEAVLEYTLTYFEGTRQEQVYPVRVLEPDALIVDTLTDIYDFVQDTGKMPVRYFPENVQKQVQEILGGSSLDIVDILHMTEFFGMVPELTPVDGEEAKGLVKLEADYVVGQLVVVMFGDVAEVDVSNLSKEEIDKIQWTPLAAEVTTPGEVTFFVPGELMKAVANQECLFLVLTDRIGGAGQESMGDNPVESSEFIPSKDAGDLSGEYDVVTDGDGTVLPDDFRIFIRPHTEQTQREIVRLQQFMTGEGKELPIASYFTEELQSQMALLLHNVEPDSLICYNANFLGAEHYKDTYGDVIAGFRFATPYREGTQVVCLLGTLKHPLPENQSTEKIVPEESDFDWYVLRAEVMEGYVFITFPQQLIPIMEEEGALALILSEPLTTLNSGEDA